MTSTEVVSGAKLSVAGPLGTVDLVLPWGSAVATVAHVYAEELGLASPPALATTAGRLLDPEAGIEEAGLDSGSVLVAVGPRDRETAPEEAAAPGERQQGNGPVAGLRWVALAAAGLGAVVTGFHAEGPLRLVCGALLAVGALMAALPTRARFVAPVAPGMAAAAVFVLVRSDGEGAVLLAVAAAGLGAAAMAACSRSLGTSGHDEHVRTWLVTGLGVALVASGFLLVGVSATLLAPTLFGIALLAARLLPSLAVDVPDHLLLDLDKLAVTAWSAREQPKSKRRKVMVRRETVAELLASGQQSVYGGCLALSVAAVACAPVMALRTEGTVELGNLLLLFFGGGALLLIARAHRARLPHYALNVAGGWSFVLLGMALVLRGPESWLPWLGALSGVVAVVVLVAAVALGSGWRSVWWARVGEIAETMTFVLALAALPVAVGLFDYARQLTS